MQNSNTIEHKGIVLSVDEQFINVRITSHPSCAGCAATNICDVSGKNDKIIRTRKESEVITGEEVSVVMSQSQGFRALYLGYLIPFLLVVSILITLVALNIHELISGLFALGSLVPYYIIVYLSREKISKKFSFSIKKQNR